MKKFLMFIVIFIFLGILAVVGFLLTFNVDQYRPQIEGRLSEALGKSVRLEKISIGWHGGIALSLRGLLIAHDEGFQKEFIRLEIGKADLNLMPLLAREIQISSVYLDHPVIRLVKKSNGELEGFEKKPESPSAPSASKPSDNSPQNTAAALSFLVSDILIEDAEIFYRDESGPEPVQITLRDLDMKIKNVALNQLIDVDARAALFSRKQNTRLTGSLKVSPQTQQHMLRNVHGELDLGTLDADELSQLIPSLGDASKMPQMAGYLVFDVDTLQLNAQGMKEFAANMQLTQGKVTLPDLKAPVENITVRLMGTLNSVKLQDFTADFAGGKFQGKGVVNLKTPKPLTTLDLAIENLSLENVLEPSQDPKAPQLKGILSGTFQGTMAGNSSEAMMQTLAGDGQLTLERGVVKNLNVLREVFQKLSMIPGLMDSLRSRLPETYQEKLDARDTVFETIQLPVAAKEGVLTFNPLNVRTDSFALQGGGRYGLATSALGAQANLFIDPPLTEALIRSVKELQSLTDRNTGALMIPLNVQGILPNISVMPDLQYIASRLAMATTQDLIGGFFKKPETQTVDPQTGQSVAVSASPAQEPASGSGEPAKAKLPKGSQILGQLLQNVLLPEGESTDSSSRDSGSSTSLF